MTNTTDNSTALLRALIGFDTTSYKSNLNLIDFVVDYFDQYGVTCTLVKNQSETKANLFATVGRPDVPGVMLSGHTDVVPVDGQDWSSDPFELRATDNAYFGRGTADMKGFLASALAIVPQLVNTSITTPVHFAFSYDEEIGCLGVRRLIDMLQGLDTRPALAIIGEPTNMQPVIGHKGKLAFRVSVVGKAGHSAYTTEAVNAVEYAARLITMINDIHRSKSSNGPFDQGYQVPHTTLHTGTIKGGTALNIVPSECEFLFEIRNVPTDDPTEIMATIKQNAKDLADEMCRIDPSCSITFNEIINYPGLNTDPDAMVTRFVEGLLDQQHKPGHVSFGTEAGLFSQRLNVPSVVCGPGSILQAHKPDEYLLAEQLTQCDQFMHRLANRCLSPL